MQQQQQEQDQQQQKQQHLAREIQRVHGTVVLRRHALPAAAAAAAAATAAAAAEWVDEVYVSACPSADLATALPKHACSQEARPDEDWLHDEV